MQHACCVPGSCSGDDAVKVMSGNGWCFEEYANLAAASKAEVLSICEPMERDMGSTHGWATIAIFCLFAGCGVTVSVVKRFCVEFRQVDSKVLDRNWLISIFDVQSLWTAFGRTRSRDKSALNFLDGIRVFSMTWVVAGHSFMYYLNPTASNRMTMVPSFYGIKAGWHYLLQDFYMIFIEYAPYSVDTFFFLSGLLATFSVHRAVKKMGDKPHIYIPMSYLARFLRIAPMMMFVTAIQWTLADQIPYGYHVLQREQNYAVCKDNWYKILFFYANLGLSSDSTDSNMACMGHLWYIQCDMQMFLLLT